MAGTIEGALLSGPSSPPESGGKTLQSPCNPACSRIADTLAVLGCFALAGWWSWYLASSLDPALYREFAANVWFQADLGRTVSNMLDAHSDHYRTSVHPIFSLLAYPVVCAIRILLPRDPFAAAWLFNALVAGAWTASLYVLWRRLGCGRFEALSFVALGLSSAAFMFWFAVPETYGLGSLSIIAVLLIAGWFGDREVPGAAVLAGGLGSLSITVTNWMAGLVLAFARLPWQRALRISGLVLVIIAALSIVQKLLFPSAGLFFLGSPRDLSYLNAQAAGSLVDKLRALVLYPMVVPPPLTLPSGLVPFWDRLSVQLVPVTSMTPSGLVGLGLWVSLLGAGVWGSMRQGIGGPFLLVLELTLAGQVALHSVYGDETFLYSLHLLPLLLTVSVMGRHTPLRQWLPFIAFALAALAALNNWAMFGLAHDHVLASLTQREQVQHAMRMRQTEVWPRGEGHVVLGRPEDSLADKAYHEPGGGYSPSPGSFGVSIWVGDASGKPVASSDTLSLDSIRQSLIRGEDGTAIGVRTETPFYTAAWRLGQGGRHFLELQPSPRSKSLRFWLVARSVGPAGGPIRHVRYVNQALELNRVWRLEGLPTLSAVIANENDHGVQLQGSANTADDPGGWLFAALEVPADRASRLTISRDREQLPMQAFASGGALLEGIRLPEPRFVAALSAQPAHLLAGLTEGETRPGEPLNYTFDWARDGAYVLVALVRSGHLDQAARIARRLAERDFFGGFGAEADAPGLVLWALAEVSAAKADLAFDRYLWPHVQRKTAQIESCLRAVEPVVVRHEGPLVPGLKAHDEPGRVCEAAWDGLMIGRMDKHYPVLFVNAASYAGLAGAARIAARLGEGQEAQRLLREAENLKAAWNRMLLSDETTRVLPAARRFLQGLPDVVRHRKRGLTRQLDIAKGVISGARKDRTYVAGLWPTWVAATNRTAYEDGLEQRWRSRRDQNGGFHARPVWTYFELAEAHQWLYLGQPERAWQTLNWFFDHQSSPGLFTWWEGTGESNSSHLWESVRGWVRPSGVTPHYWTAAEMLLLQLDMLAYVDESDPDRPVVVGAGVKPEWLGEEMASGTVYTSRGPVQWSWRGGVLRVSTESLSIPMRLAGAFAGHAKVERTTLTRPAS